MYRRNRSSRGGGVHLAVHSSLSSSYFDSPPDLEVVCATVANGSGSDFLFCLVYVPPRVDTLYHSRSIQFFELLLCLGHHVIILGDFNAPDICWATLCGSTPYSNTLRDFVVAGGLEQCVTFPTHSCGNTLDLFLCLTPGLVHSMSSLSSPLLSSDHVPISFDLSCPVLHPRKNSFSWVYAYKKTDFEGLNSFLLDYDFSPLYLSTDIEFAWKFLKGVLLTSISLFTPLIKIKSASLPRWFTPSIRHQLHKIHSLRKRYRRQPSSFNLYHLTSAECLLQLSICDARVDFEGQMIHNFLSQKNSSILRYIRSRSGKPKLPSVMSCGSCAANTPSQIANLFNQYFHSVYSDSTLPVKPPPSLPEHSIRSIELSQHDTFLSICSFNGDKAMGGDGIPL